MGNAINILLAY